MSKVYYTVKMDERSPYVLVLESPDARKPEKYEGLTTAREWHAYMHDEFGDDVVRLSATQFQEELERRQVHTPEVVALLKRDGDLLGQDLSQFVVYGSYNRPMDSLWARIDSAVYIQVDKWKTGYHTYVAVPATLDEETVTRYELAFISHGQVEEPSECERLSLRDIPIDVDDGGQS